MHGTANLLRAGLCLGLVFLALSPAACRRKGGGAAPLVVLLESYPASLDPRIGTDQASARFQQLVFEGLTRISENSEPVPELAESWETPSPTVYLFHLRRDAFFHDGRPLRAADVVHTYAEFLAPGFLSAKKEPYEVIDKVEAVDEFTVRFELKRPFASFLYAAAMGVVPSGGAHSPEHPVGTGRFAFAEAARDDYILFRAHGKHPSPPAVPALELRVVSDASSRVMQLQKGAAQLAVNNVPASSLALFSGEPRFQVLKSRGANLSYVGFNLEDPVLSSEKVRRALMHALDRGAMLRGLLDGLGEEADSILPPHHWAALEGRSGDGAFDPVLAERLLDEAGFRRGKDGIRFRLLYKTSTDEAARQKAVVVQEQWAAAGVALDIRSFEFATFYDDIRKGNFQVFSLTWVGLDDPDILYYMFHGESIPPKGGNRGRYRNPEVDALLSAARLEFDRPRQAEYYRRVQRAVMDDLPYIPLWYSMNTAVAAREVRGFHLSPTGNFRALGDVQWAP
jgi:peptide/nickel transport system substrate-binding protein